MKETRFFRKNYVVDRDNVQIMYVRSDIGKRIDKAQKWLMKSELKIVGIEVSGISWDIGLIVDKAENVKISE